MIWSIRKKTDSLGVPPIHRVLGKNTYYIRTHNNSRIFLILHVSIMEPNELFVFPNHRELTLFEVGKRCLEVTTFYNDVSTSVQLNNSQKSGKYNLVYLRVDSEFDSISFAQSIGNIHHKRSVRGQIH